MSNCVPQHNKDQDQESSGGSHASGLDSIESITSAISSRALNLRDMMRRATQAAARSSLDPMSGGPGDISPPSMEAEVGAAVPAVAQLPSLSWPPEPLDPTSGDEDSLGAGPGKTKEKPPVSGGEERRAASLAALKLICSSSLFVPHLEALLSGLDSQGNTPLMASVVHRAYPASLVLLDAAGRVARESSHHSDSQRSTLMSMVFPPSAGPNASPLHVICCNDTCSFTWTGAEHINQDIFECRTCGLTESLCCCTECARVCHKGHDCKLKRTSPTAYCDCWEKCKCKSLVAGHQGARFDVLCRLIQVGVFISKCDCSSLATPIFLSFRKPILPLDLIQVTSPSCSSSFKLWADRWLSRGSIGHHQRDRARQLSGRQLLHQTLLLILRCQTMTSNHLDFAAEPWSAC